MAGLLQRVFGLGETVKRVDPLEGTNISLFNSIIPDWWQQNVSGSFQYGTASLAERVWVANRCQQMNAQQIASMPLEFHGTSEPAWVSSPDPHWFPNGIGDAIHAIVDQMYGWGFVCLYVTDIYADGYPRHWTVLDSSRMSISQVDGSRQYKYGEDILDPRRIVQIDRNPGIGLHGYSALRSYAQQAWGLLAAGNQSMVVNQGGIPPMYLKSERKVMQKQAEELQAQWMQATQRRNGAPPVVPPEITPTEMSFNPRDLALLETQEFNARVIATAYGVPSVLLNMALQGGLTYQNPGALGEMWWRFELRPTATRISAALSAQMLPAGSWVIFHAEDTFAASLADDPNAGIAQPTSAPPGLVPTAPQVAKASPVQQPGGRLTAIGGTK